METEKVKKNDADQGWQKSIWEAETGKFLRRTPASWAKILSFYVCFLSGVWLYFWALFMIFDATLIEGEPKRKAGDSVLGTVPGMDYRPRVVDYSLRRTGPIVGQIDAFLEPYYRANGSFDALKLPCTRENGYNYGVGNPCIFLKLNRVYGWRPSDYAGGDRVPADTLGIDNETIPVTCEMRGSRGPLDFLYSPKGFPKRYFPFENQDGYLSPLVAVVPLGLPRDTVVKIECKAWAPNIEHEPENSKGAVRFEVHVSTN